MKVYKFGGASVKSAEGVKRLAEIIALEKEELLVVVSAMGKMTNAFEKVIADYFADADWSISLKEIQDFHYNMLETLFEDKKHLVYDKIGTLFDELIQILEQNKSDQHAFVYDQVVCFGELLSTTIVSEYLNFVGKSNQWIDARNCIKTDDFYRSANVDWELSEKAIQNQVKGADLYITQGFIGAEKIHNFSTTLGREGSDYTAAIFAYCLNASSVSIWKDVPGVLNADPRYFENTILLEQISYREAIELAFYGASVIHPKTLQPLQQKEIPLYVRSFEDLEAPGTCVGKGQSISPKVPCYILKPNQILLSLSSLDFSFILENHISEVFKMLHEYKLKVNLIQSSAISFTVCVSDIYNNFDKLLEALQKQFRVKYNTDVDLYTIRHFSANTEQEVAGDREILVGQQSRETLQLVVR